MDKTKTMSEIVIPLCGRVLIRKDDDKKQTKGGIILPDDTKIPVITGRVVEIAADVDTLEIPIRKYDKVLVQPGNGIPVEFEDGNKLFVMPVEDVVAVFRTEDSEEDSGENS